MLTPVQKQYMEIKQKYKDCIVFFRLGDFYETFNQDAYICAKVLDIALTTKNKNSKNPTPLAWIPYHSIEKYIPKLLEKNYKIAVAEQIWEIVPWKIVERKVTQIITPWTYVKETKNENNILTIISYNKNYYLAWSDISTGIFNIQEVDNLKELKDLIFKINPKEFIIPLDINYKEELEEHIKTFLNPFITHWSIPYDVDFIIQKYTNIKSFDSFGKALDNLWKKEALWTFLSYLQELNTLPNILKIKFYEKKNNIYFDMLSIKNLEIIQSSYDQDKKHSLLNILDNTITSVWARTLKKWLLNPTKSLDRIKFRQEGFEYFQKNQNTDKIINLLKDIYDIERVFFLIINKHNNPFYWLKLKISLEAILKIQELDTTYIKVSENVKKLYEKLNKWLKDEGFSIDKDYIKDWFSSEIDELRKIAYKWDTLIIDYQQELVKKFKINVRIKYINNQWYLIEVSKKDSPNFEKLYLQENEEKFLFSRKQTLKTTERYISSYLKKLEDKILSAHFQLQEKEHSILEDWKKDFESVWTQIEKLALNIANIDIFTNLWIFFKENNYTKPEFTEKWIQIIAWRHPVIEKFLPVDENFIENDINIKKDIVHIITWPNMWWKSTFLRQNAIILLLAHCGFFVPAKSCKTQILSWIFARVGSWDVLVKNQSTFMTEMIEVSNILNNADENSFIIFDELGRWTSTYDGIAISQAVILYLIDKLKTKTLFATHYHELTKLEERFPNQVKNFSVAVYDKNNEIIFMKKIIPHPASKSYGIHVAQLAWLPYFIIDHAENILKNLENNKKTIKQNALFDIQDNAYKTKYEKLKTKLDNIDINNLTPLQALEVLNTLRKNS